ncbi:MAG: glycosyltransferase family 9 protein [Phycisphaeraceae bacterium]|nr:glycosyltransferase family 9 protein [Phycisphaeraceae bacterium]
MTAAVEAGSAAWVVHAGALGDFVMTWPLLRAMVRLGIETTVVARASHARLAAGRLGVHAVDIEQPVFNRLWTGEAGGPAGAIGGARAPSVIVHFVADPATPAGRGWGEAAARAFGAEVIYGGAPGSPERGAVWRRFGVASLGGAPAAEGLGSAVLLHTGAGARAKRWPVDRWVLLAERLRSEGHDARLVAGEAELERDTDAERAGFLGALGEYLEGLETLEGRIASARVVIAADTGPAHLAAQMGVPTIALFGPTDPGVWSPIGPGVVVLAPPEPGAEMTWLAVETVARCAAAVAGRQNTLRSGARRD